MHDDSIGRKTNNDLETFNKQANANLTKDPSIFKFVNFLRKVDGSMSLQVNDYLGNPLNSSRFQKNCNKIRKEEKLLDLKNAFIRNELNLADYIYAVDICQVEILDKYITCTICLKFCHLL